MRMTVSRGTIAGDTGDAPLALNWSVNAAPPGGCTTRTYAPDPAHSLPLRFTALPPEIGGTNG